MFRPSPYHDSTSTIFSHSSNRADQKGATFKVPERFTRSSALQASLGTILEGLLTLKFHPPFSLLISFNRRKASSRPFIFLKYKSFRVWATFPANLSYTHITLCGSPRIDLLVFLGLYGYHPHNLLGFFPVRGVYYVNDKNLTFCCVLSSTLLLRLGVSPFSYVSIAAS